jgi:hypothetical protein
VGTGRALLDWTVNPGGGINRAAVRALIAGYRERAGGVPELDLGSFRGAVTGLANYASGLIAQARAATGEERRHAERSVRHLLSHLPARATLDGLLVAAAAGSGAQPGRSVE